MPTVRIPKPSSAQGDEARIKDLRASVEKDPFNVNLRLMLASALEDAERQAEAIKILQETIEKARRNLGVTYCTLGSSFMKANKPDEAFRLFDMSIEVDPTNAAFYLSNKAAALTKVGLADKAKALYQDLLQRKDLAKQTRRIVLDNLKQIGGPG